MEADLCPVCELEPTDAGSLGYCSRQCEEAVARAMALREVCPEVAEPDL